jgi:hypothetical protein
LLFGEVRSTIQSCFVPEHGLERIEIGVGAQREVPSNFFSSSILSGSIAKCPSLIVLR